MKNKGLIIAIVIIAIAVIAFVVLGFLKKGPAPEDKMIGSYNQVYLR